MAKLKEKRVLIISGGSGSGKTTLVKKLAENYPNTFSVIRSVTTREPRGKNDNYTFVTKEQFIELQNIKDFFLESNIFCANNELYGSPAQEVYAALTKGKIPILTIDISGASSIMNKYKQFEFFAIFLYAPPLVIYKRLRKRGEGFISSLRRTHLGLKENKIASLCNYNKIIKNTSDTAYKEMVDAIQRWSANCDKDISKNIEVDNETPV